MRRGWLCVRLAMAVAMVVPGWLGRVSFGQADPGKVDRTIVRPIELGRGGAAGSLILIRFHSGGRLDERGSALAAVASDGQAVPFRVLAHDPLGQTVLGVDVGEAKGLVELHYGAAAEERDDTLPVSLVLRTYAWRGGDIDLSRLLKVIGKARPEGVALVRQISMANNPFGDNRGFVSDFQGLLKVEEAGTYRLFSVNDDAGFVLIDDKPVIVQPTAVMTRSSEALGGQSTAVKLGRGEHRVRYVHVQRGEQTMAVLGMMHGDRALPVSSRMFVHHREVKLGKARFADGDGTAGSPVGFDVQQVDQYAYGDYLYARFRFTLIGEGTGRDFHWYFGDGSSQIVRDGAAEATDHVYVRPMSSPGGERWRVKLAAVRDGGQANDRFESDIGVTEFDDTGPIGQGRRLFEYAETIGRVEYGQANRKMLLALYELLAATERPALVAPVAGAYVERFGERGGSVVFEMKYMLATHLAAGEPERAAALFGEIARGGGGAGNGATWKRTCAAAEQFDLLIFRLGQAADVSRLLRPLLSGRPAREIALLKSRLGDVHRAAGDAELASKAYEAAGRVVHRHLDARRAAVLQAAYREAAVNLLQQQRYPALRDVLFQWEADFPAAKVGGDVPLLTGRYFQAVERHERAAAEFESVLKLDSNHPSRPQLLFRLAVSLDELGRDAEAAAMMKELNTKYPNSPFADNHD